VTIATAITSTVKTDAASGVNSTPMAAVATAATRASKGRSCRERKSEYQS
jgi:hypothetical protein